MPEFQHNLLCCLFVGISLSLVRFILCVLRNRHFAKTKGCQESQSRAPVRDPFVGVDFIYERLLRGSPAQTLHQSCQMFQKLGPTYTINRWTSEAIHTCDPRNIKHMLATSFQDFRLPKVRISVMTGLLGTGIFTLDGRSWTNARAILKPALTKQQMEKLPIILDFHVRALLQRIPLDGSILDLQPLFFCATMDVATEFLMGHSTYMLHKGQRAEQERQFVDDYMLCSEEAARKMRFGPLSFLCFNSAADRAKRRVFNYVDNYIHESLDRQPDGQSQNSFIREIAESIPDRKMLRDQILHMLLASRDTTASLLSNLFFVLSKKPLVFNKLRKEVMSAIGNDCPTFEQLKNMEYLKWCVNESLRLHPVIPSNAREAAHDTIMPYGGGKDGNSPLFIRKGTVVLYNIYAMHRDQKVFGDDPEEFIPERWRDMRPGWSYLPFNGGPRVCIGQQFALLETYYIVARLVQAFEVIESRDPREWMELSALATTCKNGVHMSMKWAKGC